VLGGSGVEGRRSYARDKLQRLRGSNSSSEMFSRWLSELEGGVMVGRQQHHRRHSEGDIDVGLLY